VTRLEVAAEEYRRASEAWEAHERAVTAQRQAIESMHRDLEALEKRSFAIREAHIKARHRLCEEASR
jgi:uncharacterized protein YPO0396